MTAVTHKIPVLLLCILIDIDHPLATLDIRRKSGFGGRVGREGGPDGFTFELNERVKEIFTIVAVVKDSAMEVGDVPVASVNDRGTWSGISLTSVASCYEDDRR